MDETDLPTGFTWKRGFFINQSKGQQRPQVLEQAAAKRILKKQCLLAEKMQNQHQRTVLTSAAVTYNNYIAMASDPAPPLPLHVTTVTTPSTEPDARPKNQHDPLASTTIEKGTVPHATPKQDDDHIHCASPIRGLPPEDKHQTGLQHTHPGDNSTQPQNQEKRKDIIKTAQCLQNHPNQSNQTRTGQTTVHKNRDEPIDPSAPPPPPNASEGPKAVMQAIDVWFDYRDRLKSAPRTPSCQTLDAEEGCTAVTTTDRIMPDQQSANHPSTLTGIATHHDVQPAKKRVKENRASWNKGFLTITKTPKSRIMLPTMQHCQNTTKLINNIHGKESKEANKGIKAASIPNAHKETSETIRKTELFDKPRARSPNFLQRYDVRMKLSRPKGETYSEWEAISNFSLQLQAFDKMIQVEPWQAKDQNWFNPPIAIASIQQSLFILHTYIPHLASMEASWTARMELGTTQYPTLLLRSTIHPAQLVKKMGPWLRATKQGLWLRQLPQVEQTKCWVAPIFGSQIQY